MVPCAVSTSWRLPTLLTEAGFMSSEKVSVNRSKTLVEEVPLAGRVVDETTGATPLGQRRIQDVLRAMPSFAADAA